MTTREIDAVNGPPPDGKPRLLLVEDERPLLEALARVLSRDFEVTAVADGAAAAELVTRARYDVVLTDIVLPGMTGIELLRLTRTYDLDVPIAILTGQPSVDTAIDALNLGAIGYLTKPFQLEPLLSLLHRAVKLSRLARARRNAVPIGARALAGDRAGLHACLDRAMSSLTLAFQPIVDRRTKRTMGFEALMRPREPSMPTPDAVLIAAERLDRLPEVGRRVRELATMLFRPAEEGMTLFVNLHPADLLDPRLFDRAAPLTRIATHVVLEITERASLDAVSDTKHRVSELRERGFRIALDDLGAGYAGLTSFATLEPEIVKLDMELVRGIERSLVRQQIVGAIIDLSRDLGMQVVAEGIESAAELATLVDLRCDLLQGYLLGRPGPALVTSSHAW